MKIVSTPETGNSIKTVLYDAGGWFLLFYLIGVPLVGLIIDYFWNLLILSLGLKNLHAEVSTRRKWLLCILITVLGLLIDWVYYQMTWGSGLFGHNGCFNYPGGPHPLEYLSVFIPMAVLMIEYFILSKYVLHLQSRQAVILSLVMGFFTTPWLIIAWVYVNW